MRLLVLLAAVLATVYGGQFSYEGYKVFQINVTNEEQFKALKDFNKHKPFDFLTPLTRNERPTYVLVEPKDQHILGEFLYGYHINHAIVIDDFEEIVQEERLLQSQGSRDRQQRRISFTKYLRYAEIDDYLNELVSSYPDLVTIESAGSSFEGRDLKVIKISSNPAAKNPVIFIDAGIHAREWIAPAQAVFIINQLLENPYNKNLIEKVDWHILPLLNPDGYEYTHTDKRMWRKTRTPQKNCYGVDGNRNFGFHWGENGASADDCDDTFMGVTAFSEKETQALRDYVLKYKDTIRLYLTLHSSGEALLYPWGYTSDLPDDHEELQKLGDAVAKSIEEVQGTVYTVGSSTNVFYPAAGGSDDWAKGVAGVQLSYTIELPGRGYGFSPPPNKILDISTETWVGIRVFHSYIQTKFAA